METLLHLFYSADIVTCRYGHLLDITKIIHYSVTSKFLFGKPVPL